MPKSLLIICKKMLNFVVFAEKISVAHGDITLLASWPKVLGRWPLAADSIVLLSQVGGLLSSTAERKKV
jgi:hypothetical protein